MEVSNTMPTLSRVLTALHERNIDNDFRWTQSGFSIDGEKVYAPEELTIVKIYRFEEMKDPGDLCVLYLIEANDGTMGYILEAYGTYGAFDETAFQNALRRIPEQNRKDQLVFEL